MKQADIIQALKQNDLERIEAVHSSNMIRLIELQSVRIYLLELLLNEQKKAA